MYLHVLQLFVQISNPPFIKLTAYNIATQFKVNNVHKS